MIRWTAERELELRTLWDAGGTTTTIARAMGTTRNSIIGKSNKLNLHYRPGAERAPLRHDHPAIREGRSLFPSKVRDPVEPLLKPGDYSRKIGGVVAKGRWRGMPIFCLTLEERATCPRSCALWAGCYGNNMHAATRYRHGPALEVRLHGELAQRQRLFPFGFVVRAHVLGDWYSVSYLEQWSRWLDEFPALHVFGYTAWQRGTPIGDAVAALRDARWDRFAVRTSGAAEGPRTKVIERGTDPGDFIVCPAQTGRTASCATCSLCWASQRPVVFVRH